MSKSHPCNGQLFMSLFIFHLFFIKEQFCITTQQQFIHLSDQLITFIMFKICDHFMCVLFFSWIMVEGILCIVTLALRCNLGSNKLLLLNKVLIQHLNQPLLMEYTDALTLNCHPAPLLLPSPLCKGNVH